MACQKEEMLELYIPILKSIIGLEENSFEVQIIDDERYDQCGNDNEDGFNDANSIEGCSFDDRPAPAQGQKHMGFQNEDEMNYRLEEYREEYNTDDTYQDFDQQENQQQGYRGRDDWNGRPAERQQNQGRGDRFSEESNGCMQDQNDPKMAEPKECKEVQTYTMKKLTLCELLKARQKNKKTRKAVQALMDLKQSMGNRMNGSFFQRGGQGQKPAQIQYGGGRGRGHLPGNSGKANNKPKDEYETFAMSLVPELKKLDDQQIRQFKWKVFQLIDEISAESDSGSSGYEQRGGQQRVNQMQRYESDYSGSGVLYDEGRQCCKDQSTDHVQMSQCGDESEQWQGRENSQPCQQQSRPCQLQNRPQQCQPQRQQPCQQRQQYDQFEPQQPRQRQCGQRAPPSRQDCNPQPSTQCREPPRQQWDHQTRQQHCNQNQPRQQQYQQHCNQDQPRQQQYQQHCNQQPQQQQYQQQCNQDQPRQQHYQQNCNPQPPCCEPPPKSPSEKQSKDERKQTDRHSSLDSEDTFQSARSSQSSSDRSSFDSARSSTPQQNKRSGKRVSYEN